MSRERWSGLAASMADYFGKLSTDRRVAIEEGTGLSFNNIQDTDESFRAQVLHAAGGACCWRCMLLEVHAARCACCRRCMLLDVHAAGCACCWMCMLLEVHAAGGACCWICMLLEV